MKKNLTLLLVFALSLLLLPDAAAKKYTFPVSTVIPAAVSTLKTSTDKNSNNQLDFTVQHIAPADRLQPARTVFVLWAETTEAGVINLGAVSVSKKLKGSLSTVTPFTPVRVFLTAEDNAKTMVPSGQVVLNTSL
ncbi:MAG: hypothetical protein AB7C90_10015 [Bacteroidales bacterium]